MKKYKISTFQQICSMCNKDSFFKLVSNKSQIIKYDCGPLGSLFQQNFTNEWKYSCLSNRDIDFFLKITSSNSFQIKYDPNELLKYLEPVSDMSLPIGIANLISYDHTLSSDIAEVNCNTRLKGSNIKITPIKDEFNDGIQMIKNNDHQASVAKNLDFNLESNLCKYFTPLKGTLLQSIVFVSPLRARELYYQWQQQRKIWWRKFAFSPGRFVTSEHSNKTHNVAQIRPHYKQLKSVDIIANFNLGVQIMEEIHLCELPKTLSANFRDGNKCVIPMCLISIINLEASCLGLLRDCCEDNDMKSFPLHRKLAPYQCWILYNVDGLPSDDLLELGRHICGILRKAHISVNHTTNSSVKFEKANMLSVPYCLLLSEDTLKNGILALRNRDTNLQEQIHVSDLPDSIVKL